MNINAYIRYSLIDFIHSIKKQQQNISVFFTRKLRKQMIKLVLLFLLLSGIIPDI